MTNCSTCGVDKPDSEFHFKNKAKGKLSTKCKECTKAYLQEHYKQNKTEYKGRSKRDRSKTYSKFREFVTSMKLACAECGENHPAVLDFHHTDPSTKEANPSQISSKTKFLKEIEKCIVLCSNCHRKLHWNQRAADGN